MAARPGSSFPGRAFFTLGTIMIEDKSCIAGCVALIACLAVLYAGLNALFCFGTYSRHSVTMRVRAVRNTIQDAD